MIKVCCLIGIKPWLNQIPMYDQLDSGIICTRNFNQNRYISLHGNQFPGNICHELSCLFKPGKIDKIYYIQTETKKSFCRQHLQKHFIEWKLSYFDLKFIEVCSWGTDRQQSSIGSDNGLASARRQAIIRTNSGLTDACLSDSRSYEITFCIFFATAMCWL